VAECTVGLVFDDSSAICYQQAGKGMPEIRCGTEIPAIHFPYCSLASFRPFPVGREKLTIPVVQTGEGNRIMKVEVFQPDFRKLPVTRRQVTRLLRLRKVNRKKQKASTDGNSSYYFHTNDFQNSSDLLLPGEPPFKKFVGPQHLVHTLTVVAAPCDFVGGAGMADVFHRPVQHLEASVEHFSLYKTSPPVIFPVKDDKGGSDILNIGDR